MTRAVSAGLQSHLDGNATTIARMFKILRTDAVGHYFTDHDSDLVFGGDTYTAVGGHRSTAVEAGTGLGVDNLEVSATIEAAGLADADIYAGVLDGASYEIFLVNWADLTQGRVILSVGTIGNVVNDSNVATVELRSLAQYLHQSIGRSILKRCDAALGDARCGVALSGYTVSGVVASVTDRRQFTAGSGSPTEVPTAPGGLLTFVSGDNAGFSREIQSISGLSMIFMLPFPYDPQPGDAYTAYRGCDKTRATCRDVFSNVINFRGFPDIVGNDAYYTYPDAR